MSEDKVLIVKVNGHTDDTLRFYPFSSCGDINDGVAFAHGNHGGWVISYDDLMKIADAAIEERLTKRAVDELRARPL